MEIHELHVSEGQNTTLEKLSYVLTLTFKCPLGNYSQPPLAEG